jgi:phosphoglycerol transferase MdoB-like AlkP superfamily enzyme
MVFILAKFIFLAYHWSLTRQFSITDILGVFIHGFWLDLSASGYIVMIPLVFLIITSFLQSSMIVKVLRVYTLVAISLVCMIILADLEIYKYWGIRFDNTALRFLGKPKEMLASITWSSVGILLLSLIAFTGLLFAIYKRCAERILKQSVPTRWKEFVMFILLLPMIFIGIRGGVDVATMNISRVYFHPQPYPNQAAINALWNSFHSLLEKKDQANPFITMDQSEALRYVSALTQSGPFSKHMLKESRPNIVLIVLESFTSKLIEPLGGLAGVTPNFNRLCHQGILFNHFFANDSRTDKSLISILCGYPALGNVSIIKFPEKTSHLGILSRDLRKAGYHCAFYYGGNADFASISSLLINGQFQQITDVSSFNRKLRTARWGVHDEHTFERLLQDCSATSGPYFKVLLTLSNHEPFDIPINKKYRGSSVDSRLCSAAWYTDSCFNSFISKAKQASWWNNTLIIVMADHGTIYPRNTISYYPEKYNIPMLWLGGVICTDTIVSDYCMQSDLAATLLQQLQLSSSDYPFSKDIFHARYPFAFYESGNRFGIANDSGLCVYDYDLNQILLKRGRVSDFMLMSGKAMQQEVYEYFLRH